MKALEGVTVIEQENVAETQDVQQTMESMINFDGASLLFPTSFSYSDPHILKAAPNCPDVQFWQCGGLWSEGMPENTGSCFGYIGMVQNLSRIAAGHAIKTKKIELVAAKATPRGARKRELPRRGRDRIDVPGCRSRQTFPAHSVWSAEGCAVLIQWTKPVGSLQGE